VSRPGLPAAPAASRPGRGTRASDEWGHCHERSARLDEEVIRHRLPAAWAMAAARSRPVTPPICCTSGITKFEALTRTGPTTPSVVPRSMRTSGARSTLPDAVVTGRLSGTTTACVSTCPVRMQPPPFVPEVAGQSTSRVRHWPNFSASSGRLAAASLLAWSSR
jgi:hypothetical protein